METYIHGNPEITFMKQVYKRPLNVHLTRKEYLINKNLFVFSKLNQDASMDVLNKIWIEKSSEIKRISLLFVKTQTLGQIENFQPVNQIEKLDTLLLLPDTKLVSSFTPDTIEFTNSFNDETEDNTCIQLPMDNLAFVLGLLDSNDLAFVIHVERVSELSSPIKMLVRYVSSKTQVEIQRFRSVSHEYLTRRFVETDYQLAHGENLLDINWTGTNLATIVIKSPVELVGPEIVNLEIANGKITETSQYNFISCEKDPTNKYKSTKWKFYTLDQIKPKEIFEFGQGQPGNSYTFTPNHKIKCLNLTEPVNITIGYVIFDTHRYVSNPGNSHEFQMHLYKIFREQNANTQFMPRFDQLVAQPGLLQEHEYQNEITNWFNTHPLTLTHMFMHIDENYEKLDYDKYRIEHIAGHLEPVPAEAAPVPGEPAEQAQQAQPAEQAQPDPIPQPNPPNQPNPIPPYKKPLDKIGRFFELYQDIIGQLIETAEKAQSIKQPVESEDICELLFHQFEPNDYYYSCGTCKGKFSIECYKHWIQDNTKSGKCPKCLTYIEKIPQMYQNC